jgi:hypothetical protein
VGFIFGGIGGIAGLVATSTRTRLPHPKVGKAASTREHRGPQSMTRWDVKRLVEANDSATEPSSARSNGTTSTTMSNGRRRCRAHVDLNLQDRFTSTRQMLETAVEIRERPQPDDGAANAS